MYNPNNPKYIANISSNKNEHVYNKDNQPGRSRPQNIQSQVTFAQSNIPNNVPNYGDFYGSIDPNRVNYQDDHRGTILGSRPPEDLRRSIPIDYRSPDPNVTLPPNGYNGLPPTDLNRLENTLSPRRHDELSQKNGYSNIPNQYLPPQHDAPYSINQYVPPYQDPNFPPQPHNQQSIHPSATIYPPNYHQQQQPPLQDFYSHQAAIDAQNNLMHTVVNHLQDNARGFEANRPPYYQSSVFSNPQFAPNLPHQYEINRTQQFDANYASQYPITDMRNQQFNPNDMTRSQQYNINNNSTQYPVEDSSRQFIPDEANRMQQYSIENKLENYHARSSQYVPPLPYSPDQFRSDIYSIDRPRENFINSAPEQIKFETDNNQAAHYRPPLEIRIDVPQSTQHHDINFQQNIVQQQNNNLNRADNFIQEASNVYKIDPFQIPSMDMFDDSIKNYQGINPSFFTGSSLNHSTTQKSNGNVNIPSPQLLPSSNNSNAPQNTDSAIEQAKNSKALDLSPKSILSKRKQIEVLPSSLIEEGELGEIEYSDSNIKESITKIAKHHVNKLANIHKYAFQLNTDSQNIKSLTGLIPALNTPFICSEFFTSGPPANVPIGNNFKWKSSGETISTSSTNFYFSGQNFQMKQEGPLTSLTIPPIASRNEVFVQCIEGSELSRPFIRFINREFKDIGPQFHFKLTLIKSDKLTDTDVFDYLTEKSIGQQMFLTNMCVDDSFALFILPCRKVSPAGKLLGGQIGFSRPISSQVGFKRATNFTPSLIHEIEFDAFVAPLSLFWTYSVRWYLTSLTSTKFCKSLAPPKLHCVLDLDKTLLISTDLNVVTSEQLKYVHTKLKVGNSDLAVIFRPGLGEFLSKLSSLYEFTICTMGSREYAIKVYDFMLKKHPEVDWSCCRDVISADYTRIYSNTKYGYKDLRMIYPFCKWNKWHNSVIIVDDTVDVWLPEYKKLIHKIEPFVGPTTTYNMSNIDLNRMDEGFNNCWEALKLKHFLFYNKLENRVNSTNLHPLNILEQNPTL